MSQPTEVVQCGLAGAFEQEFTVSPFILVKSISYVRNKTTSSAELRGCQLIEKAIYFFLTVCFGLNAPASPRHEMKEIQHRSKYRAEAA
jgi:hypothetical protein